MSITVIACDESASEGENLIASRHPVFVHGSTSLPLADAEDLMAQLRAATKAQAAELKSGPLLALRNRRALLEALPTLGGQANIYLVDKSFFITAKMVILTYGEFAARRGFDIHFSGLGREITNILHRDGSRAVGLGRWDALISAFNDLVKTYARERSKAPSVWPYFHALHDARAHCPRGDVADALEMLWDARHLALELVDPDPIEFRELDPLASSLDAVVRTWHARLDVPLEILHDRHSLLTPSVLEAILEGSRMQLTVGDVELPRADLRGIRVIDSKFDARVQVADILAGTGREIARMAADGVYDDPLQEVVRDMLDYNVMSSGGSPIDELVGRRPPRYYVEWLARQR
jgi:hypothetical protein